MKTKDTQCETQGLGTIAISAENQCGPVDGVPLSMTYAEYFLEEVDGDERWFGLRAFGTDKTWSFRPMGGPKGEDFTLAAEAAEGYSGPVLLDSSVGGWGYRRPDGSPMLTIAGSSLRLQEGSLIDLEGELVGPGCRWDARHPETPLIFTSWPCRVEGVMRGKRVEGVVMLDTMHMAPGVSLHASAYLKKLQIAWFGYINELADGTWESGTAIVGYGGFEALAAQHDGRPLVSTGDVEFSVEIEDRELAFPARAELRAGGETFTWTADPNGRWPVLPHLSEGHRLRQGTVSRASCAVPVRRSFSFMEGYVTRMNGESGTA